MTLALNKDPSRGRLFKLFTDLGPYFRKQQSTESSFFFDCLEICADPKKEPEEREFYGWWMVLVKDDNGFHYKRFDGFYNDAGDWVVETLSAQQQQLIDKSFALFIKRLQTLLDVETGLKLAQQQTDNIEL
ncbi:MAG: sigma factor-binding protein Crl [Psychromonas sp.]|nr:sigma factor-binding protein Crl [Psychromonas sp.]